MNVPDLEQYRQQFEKVKVQAEELSAGLNETKFNWRPAPDEWSIEECLAHLTIVGHWEVRAAEQAIEGAKARGLKGSGPFDHGFIGRFILGMTEPPVRHKVRTPRQFVPLHGQPVTAILPTFLHLQDQFLKLVGESDGLDLERVKVATPISRFLRMNLGTVFAQAAAHERRHLEQARRVRSRMPA